ncbi:keratin, type II cytoskeletal 1-like [Impatiens glandulifera]|uniref:keratin, type II cytoskeletal 1-like n=1 Tax=Impatiens glandulifera TaxID=253017 RepID=UPI001FB147E4|nr:keratin, type II cytoskeletal 1-like [Impatiens glandulifera]
MDIPDAENDAYELDAALLNEFGNISAEERRILDQPIQECTNDEEEEVIVQEPEQALETNVEEVLVEDREEEEIAEEERDEAAKKAEMNQPEQSLQIHTNFEPIQSMAAESGGNSSNEGTSVGGNKMLTFMSSVLSSLQKSMIKSLNNQEEERKDFAEILKVLKELDNTLKKNTQINDERHKETIEEFSLVKNQMVEILGCLSRNDNERQEFADSIARKFQAKEDAEDNAECAQPRPAQGESSRRNDGVSTDTKSRRAPSTDDNPRPTKRGGGRSGNDCGGRSGGGRGRLVNVDQGGRANGGERGGRSSGGSRGGRGYPPYLNMLPGKREFLRCTLITFYIEV